MFKRIVLVLLFLSVILTGCSGEVVEGLETDLAFCESSKAMLKADTDELVKHVEGLAPALEACEGSEIFWEEEANRISDIAYNHYSARDTLEKDRHTARLRVTLAYELANALTETLFEESPTKEDYLRILDLADEIDDPVLDDLFDDWMAEDGLSESLMLLFDILEWLMLDAEFYLME